MARGRFASLYSKERMREAGQMTAHASSEPRLHAALNGARVHPATPFTPETSASEARAAVAAGAEVVHLHPFDDAGRQTFDAEFSAATIRAVRLACPGVPISLSASAEIEPDPERRLALISEWTELPDLVTANQGEAGIRDVCELLLDRGVQIEAGLLHRDDALAFVDSGLSPSCSRVLVEPLDADPDAALAHAAAIEQVLTEAGVGPPQVHHGDGISSWVVNARAIRRGHGIRTGLEDTPVLIGGSQASGNGELVATAAALLTELSS
jgi:uncharacterized protein (DUF849 family)